jgi:putative hemolysin
MTFKQLIIGDLLIQKNCTSIVIKVLRNERDKTYSHLFAEKSIKIKLLETSRTGEVNVVTRKYAAAARVLSESIIVLREFELT